MKTLLRIVALLLATFAVSPAHAFGHTWRYQAQQNPAIVSSFDVSANANLSTGLVTLPSYLSITCSSTGRTTQTSATTVVTGLGANAARARNTGTITGLSVEAARSNVALRSEAIDNATWSKSGATVTADQHAGPDGASTADGVVYTAAQLSYFFQSISFGTASYTASLWAFPRSGSQKFRVRLPDSDASNTFSSDLTASGAAWSRKDFTNAITVTSSSLLISNDAAQDAASLYLWGVQLEQGKYPSSYYPTTSALTTRNADVLAVSVPGAIAPGGYFDLSVTVAPHYTQAEQSTGTHNLLFIDANDRIYINQADHTVNEKVNGVVVTSSALTWSRDQALTVTAVHTSAGLSLTVAGATTGNGTTTGAAQPAISLPGTIYMMGSSSGPLDGADLRSFTAYRR